MDSMYSYRPLRRSSSIRTFKLLLRERKSKSLLGVLVQQDLDSPECSYNALSYTWGEPDFDHVVRTPSGVLKITENLAAALQNVPLDLPLWIDAICINQNDYDERAEQVQMMGRIFRDAKTVFGWRGLRSLDEDENHPKLHTTLHQLYLGAQNLFESGFNLPEHRKIWMDPSIATDYYHLPPYNDPVWESVECVFRGEWYKRVWVLQEVILAKKCLILWQGTPPLEWNLLTAALLMCLECPYLRIGGLGSMPPPMSGMEDIKTVMEKEPELSLQGLLRLSSRLESSNPRDRIYAMLGLLPRNKPRYLVPNYNDSVRKVYTDTARAIISAEGNLDVLCAVRPKRIEGFPSWVADWRNTGFIIGGIIPKSHFSAATIIPMPLDDNYHDILAVKGGILCSISEIGDFVGTEQDTLLKWNLDESSKFKELLRDDWLPKAQMLQVYPSGERISDASALTLTAGQYQHSEILQKIYQDAFSELEKELDETRPSLDSDGWIQMPTRGQARTDKLSGYMSFVSRSCLTRRFFLTDDGYMGLAPQSAKYGDVICLLWGGQTPFIIRPEDDHWILVGECYIHGLMNGESVEKALAQEQEFSIH